MRSRFLKNGSTKSNLLWKLKWCSESQKNACTFLKSCFSKNGISTLYKIALFLGFGNFGHMLSEFVSTTSILWGRFSKNAISTLYNFARWHGYFVNIILWSRFSKNGSTSLRETCTILHLGTATLWNQARFSKNVILWSRFSKNGFTKSRFLKNGLAIGAVFQKT